MKKKSFWKDTVIVGLALFSTMFGAGNLIFPPQIGLFSGQEWFLGAMGLLLGGIVLPVMALWAVNNVGEGSEDLMGHVSPWCYNAFYLVSCTLIAMGSTLPKSAATTYEIGIQPLFPQVPNWAVIIVFFVLVYFFACDRESVIDKLGKYDAYPTGASGNCPYQGCGDAGRGASGYRDRKPLWGCHADGL